MKHAGKLKVYLGYAAGVGKTYRMLDEAQTLRAQGVDVVIGYFETHDARRPSPGRRVWRSCRDGSLPTRIPASRRWTRKPYCGADRRWPW